MGGQIGRKHGPRPAWGQCRGQAGLAGASLILKQTAPPLPCSYTHPTPGSARPSRQARPLQRPQ